MTAPSDSLIEQLPPLREVINAYGLAAKKSLGQNFLLDLNLTNKIAKSAGDLSGKTVFEIGPGPGGLTRALLATQAEKIIAVERDDRCILALQDVIAASDGRLEVIAGDALKTDLPPLAPPPRAVVANLPYNIATVLLLGWLKQIDQFDSLTLMFQKEVALRLTAKPKTKDYGRLSVITQWLCKAERKFDLPPSAFTPPPKVKSAIVHITPKPRSDDIAFATMEKITAAAFGQRRKMLRQSLKSLNVDVESLLKTAGLPDTARAEEIDIDGFVKLAQAFDGFKLSTKA